MTASIIDLSSLSTVSSRPTEANHRRYQQRQQQQSYGKLAINTLKKADEHYRSLFNLLPASLRLRHQHSKISNKKGIDTVSMKKKKILTRLHCRCYQYSDILFITYITIT